MLDVRENYEREICHIGGKHIPLGVLESHLNDLPKNKPIVCYCKAGLRSRRAVQLLLNNGFHRVTSLKGGITEWIDTIDDSLTKY